MKMNMWITFISLDAFVCSAVLLRSGEKQWPSCVLRDTALRSPQPAFADVRPFINYPDSVRHRTVTFTSQGNVGMALQEQPHDLGELVKDVLPGSQAETAGVRKGWIIKEIDGIAFSSTERLKDVAEDFARAKGSGATLTVKYDVRTFIDCTDGDCSHSDKFPTDSVERCADACSQASGCDWWSFGVQDGDNTCWLQVQGGSSLMTSVGSSSAPRSCIPRPATTSLMVDAWPQCIVSNAHINNEGTAIFTDVRRFISHADAVQHRTITFRSGGNVGMGITDGGVISQVLEGSQALSAGVRKGWIIKELDGKPFNKAESLPLVRQDFDAAKSEAPGLIVKFDVRSSKDCTNGDCTNSDKLPLDSEAACAKICSQVADCKWWSMGIEDGDKMCWLRSSDKGLRPMEGSSTGRQSCQPLDGGSWSMWWIVILAVAAYYHEQIWYQVQALPILQLLTRSGRAPLSTKLLKSQGYGTNNDKIGYQELARVDAFACKKHPQGDNPQGGNF
jgi:hypothetical protein